MSEVGNRSFAQELPAVAGFRYRPDVDGLRAVAVGLVLLFHAGFGFTGGFVGVDVFFVISGYLITGLILKEQSTGRFSLSRFWVRRIRRIIPAASAMALVTLFVGGLLLLPADYADLGQATIAQQLMVSNVFFWKTTGYFSGPAELKPLLHTWSLAVEEQFYIGYPFLLLFLRRFRPGVVLAVLLSLTLTSLALSEWSVRGFPSATFYLLPTRAWEMLVGGLIWFLPASSRMRPWQCQALSLMGLATILACSWWFDAGTRFPGAMALVPCIAAVGVIYAATGHATWTGRLLSTRPVVSVGLVSYSLYLWHWPILAYFRYWQGDLNTAWRATALVSTCAAAYLSFRLIETPFRHSERLSTLWTAGRFASLSAAMIVAFALTVTALDGLSNRFSPQFQIALEQSAWTGEDFLASQPIDRQTGLKRLGVGGESQIPQVLFWGDSHALMCSEAIHQAALSAGVPVLMAAEPGLPPVPGMHGVLDAQSKPSHDLLQDDRILQIALRPEIGDVVLLCRWSLYVEGYNEFEMSLESDGKHQIRPADYMVGPPDQLAAELEQRSVAMIQQLIDHGKRVWVIRQVPELRQRLADDVIRSQRFGVALEIAPVDREAHLTRQRRLLPVFDALARNGVQILDPGEQLFNRQGLVDCLRDGQPLYRDDDHLSRLGAQVVIEPVLETMLKSSGSGALIATFDQ